MYRALYAFRSAEPNALAFAAGETFLVLERSSTHWWLAARARSGETGYVPPAYLHRLQVSVPCLHGPCYWTLSQVLQNGTQGAQEPWWDRGRDLQQTGSLPS